MYVLSKLNSTSTTKTPHNVYIWLLKTDTDIVFVLNPNYQRNIVWGPKQYLKFIESVFYGIVPSPIVLAIDSTKNEKICVDGKQRLTSIRKFFTNEIPYFVVDDSKIVLYWYSEVKADTSIQKILEEIHKIKNFENKLITKQMKSWVENDFQLTIVQYNDINYEQQIDIFNRIQYGMTISRGSYMKSFIPDAKLCELVMKTAEKYKEYFGKYIKNANNEDHIKFMIEIFLMLEKEVVTIKTETVDYELSKLTIKVFEKLDKKYDNLIKTMFDKELLNLHEFKQRKIIVKCLSYAMDKINSDSFDKQKMKNVLEKIHNEITEEKKQFKIVELEEFINENWNPKQKKNKTTKINKKIEIEQESSESGSESESSEEEDT